MEWSEEATKRLYVDIGERIRKNRVKSDLTQTDLAHVTGLTRSSIANIEGGRQRAPIHTLYMIAQALDTSIQELMPSSSELDLLATITPALDLEGQSSATQEFVTSTLRRLAGG